MSLRAETDPCKATWPAQEQLATSAAGIVIKRQWVKYRVPKDYRIRRHNAIVNCVEEKCKGEGWTVCFEPKIVDFESKVWKPDLILVKDNNAVVLESDPSIQRANLAKYCKYAHIGQDTRKMFNVMDVEVLGQGAGVSKRPRP